MQRINFWQYAIENLPYISTGLVFTLKLFFAVMVIAFPLAIIFAVCKVSGPKWLKAILSFYTWVFRGTPIILQLYLVYYGLPNINIMFSAWAAALMVFVLSVTAYETEIIRGGIISIDKGQYEACKALGMNYVQTMSRVIIPQTVRRVLPPTCSEIIILFKDTALVTVIAVFDLMRTARNLLITDARADAYIIVLVIYLIISSILVQASAKLEKRFSLGI